MSTLDSDDVVALVTELLKQSQRLGLTWNLRRATVVGTGNALTLDDDKTDADPAVVPAISLIGNLPVGARVMTMGVPPSGLFILSWLNFDTGTINDTDTGKVPLDVTPAAGWTIASSTYRRVANVLYVRVGVTRTGATITADAGGNIADTALYTLGSAFAPFTTVYGAFRSTVSGGAAQINPTGTATIVDMHSTSTILVTQVVQTYWVYPLAIP